jgi:LexA-binding, inner membrane-associated putative hydrolase
VGMLAIAAAVAGLAAFGLRRSGRQPRFAPLLAAAFGGSALHLLLDAFHGYGERLLWPVSSARFGLPLVGSYDVATLAVLLLSIGIPMTLNLVNAEIGAARVSGARAALAGLLFVLALLPGRYALRERALAAADPTLLPDTESRAVHPSPFLPWRWYLVQDTPISYLVQEVDAIDPRVMAGMIRFRKPVENNFLVAARDAASGRAFLELAAYPLFTLQEGQRGVSVRIRDLQFYVPGAGERPYSVEIEVNSESRVLAERVFF